MNMNRRRFVQLSSSALISQILSPSVARASQSPKRLIIFHWPQGMVMPQYLPYSDGSFPYILEPLTPHRSHMTMISGIDNIIPNFNDVPTVHPNADHSLFTCTPFLVQNPNQLSPSGPSFEQIICQSISQARAIELYSATHQTKATG